MGDVLVIFPVLGGVAYFCFAFCMSIITFYDVKERDRKEWARIDPSMWMWRNWPLFFLSYAVLWPVYMVQDAWSARHG